MQKTIRLGSKIAVFALILVGLLSFSPSDTFGATKRQIKNNKNYYKHQAKRYRTQAKREKQKLQTYRSNTRNRTGTYAYSSPNRGSTSYSYTKDNGTKVIYRESRTPDNGSYTVKKTYNEKTTYCDRYNYSEERCIDVWISRNHLNRYGDPKNTVYAGGTPLYDETRGRYINRYDYIRNHHPDCPWDKMY